MNTNFVVEILCFSSSMKPQGFIAATTLAYGFNGMSCVNYIFVQSASI